MNKLYCFTADWCGPCRNLKPHLISLKDTYPNRVELLDIDNPYSKDLMETYGIKVVPTLILADDSGKEIKRANGGISYSQLVSLIQE